MVPFVDDDVRMTVMTPSTSLLLILKPFFVMPKT